MPRTNIPLTAIAGGATRNVAITWADGDHDNDHAFVNDGKTALLVENGGGAAIFVRVRSVADPATGRLGDIGDGTASISVGAGASRIFNFLPPHLFNQPHGGDNAGQVLVDLSGSTSVRVAALRFT